MKRISITKVARMLGVSKPTIYTKKRQLGLPQNHKGITEKELFRLSSYIQNPKKPGRKSMIEINPKAVNLAKTLYDAGMTLEDTALFLEILWVLILSMLPKCNINNFLRFEPIPERSSKTERRDVFDLFERCEVIAKR